MAATQRRAVVIGAGPNGLAAAIVLAQAGMRVEVFEAEPQPGGGARTLPLTLPGFLHDFGSAVHPMAAGSPFFSGLPLRDYGLEFIQPPAPLAHPLDDGTAVMLERDLGNTEAALGEDGKQWRRLFGTFAKHWNELAPETLRPVSLFPRHPFLLARLGLLGFPSASSIAHVWFHGARARALFAGLAAHSILSLEEPLTAAFGIMFAATAHAVGWPIPRGGAQSITDALCSYLATLGGRVHLSSRVENLASLGQYDVAMCDVTPRQLLRIAGDRLSPAYRHRLERYRYGPAVFKVDYALSEPVPWKAPECRRSATVHLGGTLEEIVASEDAMRHGRHAERPFVLLAQPTLFDSTRAPEGRHIAWAYCHVPNGSAFDMLPRLEAQIERFAPGFRDCILQRRAFSPATLEAMDANLVGGDIGGGLMNLTQFLFRPTMRYYATSAANIFICSSSTPPGGGVHGMCGYNAAKLALKQL
ncbi:MAG TPA: NAD(P)/FAD-dependent oxidoreductase [Candidatus Binatia bacterium]|nr:NAD(P)/FAD-dependent oxidoreductase [Candidatus Binatia bacterium]